MKEKLNSLLDNAYAPYSNYRVSAIVVMKDGSKFKGVNVENASYGATICAERNAILNAITNGYTKGDFKEIYVYTASEKLASPCFICRQVLVEFFNKDSKVILMNKNGQEEYKIEELCTHPFNSDNLD